VLLKKPPDVLSLDTFPTFHGTQRFITAFTKALHLYLSWARPIQSTPIHRISERSILMLSTNLCIGIPSGLFLSGFPLHPHSHYMSHPSHRLHNSNYIWHRVQIMQLLIMQFSKTFPPFHHSLVQIYSSASCSQTPCLSSSHIVRDKVSYPYRTTGKIIVLCILIFMFFENRWGDRRFWTEW
jgi:hypothetical protein